MGCYTSHCFALRATLHCGVVLDTVSRSSVWLLIPDNLGSSYNQAISIASVTGC